MNCFTWNWLYLLALIGSMGYNPLGDQPRSTPGAGAASFLLQAGATLRPCAGCNHCQPRTIHLSLLHGGPGRERQCVVKNQEPPSFAKFCILLGQLDMLGNNKFARHYYSFKSDKLRTINDYKTIKSIRQSFHTYTLVMSHELPKYFWIDQNLA